MKTQFVFDILVVAIATVSFGFVAVLFVVRDYAIKYRRVMEKGLNPEPKITNEKVISPTLGISVKFHDMYGTAHDALITAVHKARKVNLVIVDKDNANSENHGLKLEKFILVPHKSMTMEHGFYFRYHDEEPNLNEYSSRQNQYGATAAMAGRY